MLMDARLEKEESVLELRRQVLFETLNRDLQLTKAAKLKAQSIAHLAIAIGVNSILYSQHR
jgi:hypothetical protein